ncbi:hypothetical protein EBT25_04940 [bacterium]|nr:hypothetical protein [bacterium]
MSMHRTEVLAIGTVIGILGVISGFLVLNARSQLRDVTRIAHMREMQIGLDLFYMEQGVYPEAAMAIPLGQVASACLAAEGFSSPCGADAEPYLEFVPETPAQGLKELSSCGGKENAYCYASDKETFRIQFELESANAELGLQKGANCLTENGFSAGVCQVYSTTADEEAVSE